jgi:hypothetical protein
MSSDQNEFEGLRRLLALKRHEQPPPGYFNRLPGQIMARIEREGKLSFWERFVEGFSFRPAFAYSFALAAFSALTFSVFYSARMQPGEIAQTPANNGWRSGSDALADQVSPSEALHVANFIDNEGGSNPAPVLPSLFSSGPHAPTVHVSYASP